MISTVTKQFLAWVLCIITHCKVFGIRKVCANSWYYISWLRSFNYFDPDFFYYLSVCLEAFCVWPTSVFMSRSTTTGRWIRQQTARDKIHCYNLFFYTFIINTAVSTITKNIRWGTLYFKVMILPLLHVHAIVNDA